ncbi:MAG: hypothetical protein ACRET7_02810 [Burkholderiales bacterium]
MTIRKYLFLLGFVLAGCTDPEAIRRLEADIESVNERITQAQEERKAYGKGSVVHDLISLRIAVHQQTLAMLEQRHAAERWRTTLAYSVDGKPYAPPADAVARIATLQGRLKNAREGRESDLQLMRGSADSVRSLYVMSVATKTITISQLEYQLAALANGFPPYYVPFQAPAKDTTPAKIVEVPAGQPAVVQ